MNTQPKKFDLQSARGFCKEDNLSEEFDKDFFDESSKAWLLNKRRYGASYIYICGKPKCKNRVKGGGGILCKYHAANIGLQETPHIQTKGFDSKPMNEWLDSFRALEY
jgi:hypothetical protein